MHTKMCGKKIINYILPFMSILVEIIFLFIYFETYTDVGRVYMEMYTVKIVQINIYIGP